MALPLLAPGTFGQIFTIRPTRAQLTTGTVTGVSAVWCHSAGTVVVTQPGAPAETLAFTDGDQFGFEQLSQVAITDGIWSFM